MNTIELKGRIQATRCITVGERVIYYFLLCGYQCVYAGSLNFRTGDIVTVSGKVRDISYTTTTGIVKTMHEVDVAKIAK